jgi:hypothetical protein
MTVVLLLSEEWSATSSARMEKQFVAFFLQPGFFATSDQDHALQGVRLLVFIVGQEWTSLLVLLLMVDPLFRNG